MRTLFLSILMTLCTISYGQGVSKFSTDSIEVSDKTGKVKYFSCDCDFVYTDYNFIMNCSDNRVTSFLLPSSSFMDIGLVIFYDSGYTVDMRDSTGTASIGDSSNVNNIGVIYQTYESGEKMQFIQYVDSTGLSLIKRDKTYIKFK